MAEKTGTAVRVEIIEIMGGGKCPSQFEVGRTWIIFDGLCPEGNASPLRARDVATASGSSIRRRYSAR